jgi:hypothetical protein
MQGVRSLVVADHLGVVLERELRGLETVVDLCGHGAGIAPVHVDADLDPSRHRVALDHRRRRRDAHVGNVLEADMAAARCVDHDVLDAGQARAARRCAPYRDLEHLLLLEEASDLEAGEHRRRAAANVAGLEAVPLRLGEVHLHLDVGLVDPAVHPGGGHAVDVGDHASHFRRRRLQGAERRPEHPDGDVVRGPRVEVADAVVEVRAHALGDAGVRGNGVLHLGHGRAVVGRRIDGHPELGGVHVDDLIAQHGAPHVGADVGDAGYPSQVIRDARGETRHLRLRRAGGGVPAHNEIRVTERRQERLVERRPHHEGEHQDGGRAADHSGGAHEQALEHGPVRIGDPADERRLPAGGPM